jgi:hypothetical protein
MAEEAIFTLANRSRVAYPKAASGECLLLADSSLTPVSAFDRSGPWSLAFHRPNTDARQSLAQAALLPRTSPAARRNPAGFGEASVSVFWRYYSSPHMSRLIGYRASLLPGSPFRRAKKSEAPLR